jgi:hypothetical protein
MIEEVWKWALGFVGKYEVSNLGRVRSVDRLCRTKGGSRRRVKSCIRKACPNSAGYPQLDLGGPVAIVHLMVLNAFVGPCPEGMEARHLDGNRFNPALSNLCWGTKLENAQDRVTHGTWARGEKQGRAKLTWAVVEKMRADTGKTQRQLAVDYGVSRTVAGRVRRGESWKKEGHILAAETS